MQFPIQLDILDFVFKGILIGLVASAPMGPVGVLCIQRTLNKGRWYGFLTGIGACVSDIIYALITGFGMSFVMDFVGNEHNRFVLQLSGSVVLLLFGIYCYRSNPTKNMHQSNKNQKGTLAHNGITAFLVTLSNPLIIFLFIFLFAQFAFVVNDRPFEMTIGYISIIIGAMLWWFGLTWLIDKVRGKFDNYGIVLINRVVGCIVVIFSVIMLLGTVFNLYKLPY
ncbi:LysE family transporter [Prevotella sp.]|uniref:LysE family translocator n=1 Tax=uncultured Prevotella sp. TaxID=159272 RepID=UPI0025E5524A|nr:LysE family transporter [Prevotella sp.]MCI7119737.1 LysE family transporter [Prevotella sp.]